MTRSSGCLRSRRQRTPGSRCMAFTTSWRRRSTSAAATPAAGRPATCRARPTTSCRRRRWRLGQSCGGPRRATTWRGGRPENHLLPRISRPAARQAAAPATPSAAAYVRQQRLQQFRGRRGQGFEGIPCWRGKRHMQPTPAIGVWRNADDCRRTTLFIGAQRWCGGFCSKKRCTDPPPHGAGRADSRVFGLRCSKGEHMEQQQQSLMRRHEYSSARAACGLWHGHMSAPRYIIGTHLMGLATCSKNWLFGMRALASSCGASQNSAGSLAPPVLHRYTGGTSGNALRGRCSWLARII